MNSSTPPVIAFELGVGEFRIVTPEAVYQIKVCHDLVEATRVDEPGNGPPPLAGSAANADGPEPESFFQEISEELFDKIGRLARKLSVSVEELPEQLDAPDLDETDQQLENAKGQLEEVVKLTEKASMTIMDTADSIQTDMDELRSQLDILQNLDLMTAPVSPDALSQADGPAPQISISDKPTVDPAFFDKLGELRIFIENLLHQAAGEVPSAAEPEPPVTETEAAAEPEAAPVQPTSQTIVVTRFDVDVVFQTLYELCTNESVKDHIKAMREAQHAAFNTSAVADYLSELAPTVDEEDGFYNFPITAVLKSLYGATASEDFRLTLKKMNQTAASIFLDSVLPIEGETTEVEVPLEAAPEPEPAPPAPPETPPVPEPPAPAENGGPAPVCSLDDLKAIRNLAAELEHLGSALAAPAPAGGAVQVVEGGPLYTSILTRDRDTIVATVNMAHTLIRQTGAHLTRILETLSFQDLSGQRIMKVVSLIGDVQMQLLSILISVNAKLKVHQETGVTDAKSVTAESMAQAEVDKALEKLSGGSPSSLLGPGAETRLDQGAVNDLLAQLGF